MHKVVIAIGAFLVLAATMGAAGAKNNGQNRDNDAVSPSWNGTSPPGFSKGGKTWRSSTPPGWSKGNGKRRGWNDQTVPPGLYKRGNAPVQGR